MQIEPGTKAPEFSLYSPDKTLISLSSFRGQKVLILFFPLAFSSVCTAELCSVRDNIGLYNEANAAVLGISVDSLYTLGAFKKAQNLNFTLLSDFNKEVSEAYGVLHESFGYGMKGVSKRAAFIVDANGIISYAEVLDNPGKLPDFETITAKLNS